MHDIWQQDIDWNDIYSFLFRCLFWHGCLWHERLFWHRYCSPNRQRSMLQLRLQGSAHLERLSWWLLPARPPAWVRGNRPRAVWAEAPGLTAARHRRSLKTAMLDWWEPLASGLHWGPSLLTSLHEGYCWDASSAGHVQLFMPMGRSFCTRWSM